MAIHQAASTPTIRPSHPLFKNSGDQIRPIGLLFQYLVVKELVCRGPSALDMTIVSKEMNLNSGMEKICSSRKCGVPSAKVRSGGEDGK